MKLAEGVPYYRYVVRYRLKTGQRKQLTVWSPGPPWVNTEVARMLDDMHGIENVKPRSVVIR